MRRLGAAFKSGAQAPHSKRRSRQVGCGRRHDLRPTKLKQPRWRFPVCRGPSAPIQYRGKHAGSASPRGLNTLQGFLSRPVRMNILEGKRVPYGEVRAELDGPSSHKVHILAGKGGERRRKRAHACSLDCTLSLFIPPVDAVVTFRVAPGSGIGAHAHWSERDTRIPPVGLRHGREV